MGLYIFIGNKCHDLQRPRLRILHAMHCLFVLTIRYNNACTIKVQRKWFALVYLCLSLGSNRSAVSQNKVKLPGWAGMITGEGGRVRWERRGSKWERERGGEGGRPQEGVGGGRGVVGKLSFR